MTPVAEEPEETASRVATDHARISFPAGWAPERDRWRGPRERDRMTHRRAVSGRQRVRNQAAATGELIARAAVIMPVMSPLYAADRGRTNTFCQTEPPLS